METDLRRVTEAIKNKRISKIKLLGDSITHGVGGTGYCTNGEVFVDKYARNPNGYCWAKLFKEHVEEKYGCMVVNNGCSGTKIEFIIEHFDALVDDSDDLIICAIGTNNRHQSKNTGERKTREQFGKTFYDNILLLNKKLRQKEKQVIFLANLSASEKNEKDGEEYWRILHMDDINRIYKAAQEKAGFLFISLYDAFTEYLKERNEKIDEYLKDGLHPNDKGYKAIFELLCKEMQI